MRMESNKELVRLCTKSQAEKFVSDRIDTYEIIPDGPLYGVWLLVYE